MTAREMVARSLWAKTVVAFDAGDLPGANRLALFYDSVVEETDEEFDTGRDE